MKVNLRYAFFALAFALTFALQFVVVQGCFAQWISSTPSEDIPPGIGLASRPVYHHDHYRFSGGSGSSFALASDAPFASFGEAGWQHDHQLLSMAFIEDVSTTRDQPQHTWDEFDAMYGYAIDGYDLGLFGMRPEKVFASISAGLSYFNYSANYHRPRGFQQQFDTTTYSPNSSLHGFGIPIHAQAIWSPLRYFGVDLGIGVTAFANLNLQQINYGGAITFQATINR